MKLMSHNSWTFMKPKSFLGKLLNFTIKCQSANIIEQYEKYGVRLFDLRIRLDNNRQMTIAHGLFDYQNSQEQLAQDLHFLDSKRDVIIRVMLEVRSPYQDKDSQRSWFIKYCSQLQINYPNIHFCGGGPTYSYNGSIKYYRFEYPYPSVEGKHASWITKNKIDDLWPWLYAKLHNKKSRKEEITKEYLSLDFVNI